MADVPVSTLQKKRKLPFALGADACNVVFAYLTFFGPVFPLFLDSMGLDRKQIGLMLSLLPFCGLVAPFIATVVARYGFKRTFVVFYGARNLVTALLLAAPWVYHHASSQATLWYVAAVIFGFALCRSISETGYFPWNQEFIPASIRGKYAAVGHIVAVVVGLATVTGASYILGTSAQPRDYVGLITVAVGMGLVATLLFSRVPGGAPVKSSDSQGAMWHAMRIALRDRRFLVFMAASTLIVLGWNFSAPFVPLFMKRYVGLDAGQVVRLESAALLAGLISCFLWGWAADRFGSKPIIVLTLLLLSLYPVGILFVPRESSLSVPVAMALSGYFGLINPGWSIAFNRHLFVNIVPQDQKLGYLTVYYAWIGVIGGLGPLLGGWVLDLCADWNWQFVWLAIDAHTPLLAVQAVLAVLAALAYSRMPAEGAMPVTQFAGMFFQGNPFAAMQSLVAHNMARSEGQRISAIERLGDARSPLNVDELIAALDDPSYNVRLEAIVSIARTRPDERLTSALLRAVNDAEPDLAITAVWALGRIGDKRAIEPLRKLLVADYPLLASRAARSLAQLGDREVIPLLLARFHDELDDGLRIAYASALGALGCTQALPGIFAFLRKESNEAARKELTLALGRMVGNDAYLVRLWRRLPADPGTVASQALLGLRKRLTKRYPDNKLLARRLDETVNQLADNDIAGATANTPEFIRILPLELFDPVSRLVLDCSASALSETGQGSIEYLLLTLHTLNAHVEADRDFD